MYELPLEMAGKIAQRVRIWVLECTCLLYGLFGMLDPLGADCARRGRAVTKEEAAIVVHKVVLPALTPGAKGSRSSSVQQESPRALARDVCR